MRQHAMDLVDWIETTAYSNVTNELFIFVRTEILILS
jgi:hypothetical protein